MLTARLRRDMTRVRAVLQRSGGGAPGLGARGLSPALLLGGLSDSSSESDG